MKTIDVIILVLLLLAVFIGFKSTRKHLKGAGDCCGGVSTPIIPDKILKNPIVKRVNIQIEGMTCDQCSARIKKEINKMDGVSATVSLYKKEADVLMDREIKNSLLKETIENLGYEVVEMVDV